MILEFEEKRKEFTKRKTEAANRIDELKRNNPEYVEMSKTSEINRKNYTIMRLSDEVAGYKTQVADLNDTKKKLAVALIAVCLALTAISCYTVIKSREYCNVYDYSIDGTYTYVCSYELNGKKVTSDLDITFAAGEITSAILNKGEVDFLAMGYVHAKLPAFDLPVKLSNGGTWRCESSNDYGTGEPGIYYDQLFGSTTVSYKDDSGNDTNHGKVTVASIGLLLYQHSTIKAGKDTVDVEFRMKDWANI